MPLPRYNIEYKNNIFKYSVDSNKYEIIIPIGKYIIEDIIEILNKNSNNNFTLFLNTEQKIKIESDKNIILENTELILKNLGFKTFELSDGFLISDNTWDLRLNDRIYLYLDNISDIKFGNLSYNLTESISLFKFESICNFDKLHIHFKDTDDNEVSFYNLPHSLNMLFEIINC